MSSAATDDRRRVWLTSAFVWLFLVWGLTLNLRFQYSARPEAATEPGSRMAEKAMTISRYLPDITESLAGQLREMALELEEDPRCKSILEGRPIQNTEGLSSWYVQENEILLETRPAGERVQQARNYLQELVIGVGLIGLNFVLGLLLLLGFPWWWKRLSQERQLAADLNEQKFSSRWLMVLNLYLLWDLGNLLLGGALAGRLRASFGTLATVWIVQCTLYLVAVVLFARYARGLVWKPRNSLLALSGYWLAFPCILVLAQLTATLVGRSPQSSNPLLPMLGGADTLSFLTLALLVVVVGPAFEEFLFRGILFRHLRPRFGFAPAAVASALVFSLVHGDLMAVGPLFFLGLLFATLYEKSGSLFTPWLAHALWNGTTVLLLGLIF